MMLHLAGEEVMDLFDTLTVAEPQEGENVYDLAQTALCDHFKPVQNSEYQVYMFRQSKQEKSETLNQYFGRLKSIAASCQFTEVDKEIKTQIIHGCRSHKLRIKALSEPTWDLNKVLSVGRAMELSEEQAADIERAEHAVNRVAARPSRAPKQKHKAHTRQKPQRQNPKKKCWNCGRDWPHEGGQTNCPAFGKTCSKCGKQNHFSSECRSRNEHVRSVDKHCDQVDETEDDTESESESEQSAFQIRSKVKSPETYVDINGIRIKMIVDTGASVNVIDQKTYAVLNKPPLTKHKSRTYVYGSTDAMHIAGEFTALVEKHNKTVLTDFIVAEGNFGSLMSYELAVERDCKCDQNCRSIDG